MAQKSAGLNGIWLKKCPEAKAVNNQQPFDVEGTVDGVQVRQLLVTGGYKYKGLHSLAVPPV